MPRATKRCGDPTCDEPMPCPKHTRKPWAGSDRRATLPPDWEWRVQVVLERDPLCRLRLYGCTGKSEEVDHAGHRDDHRFAKLRGVCSNCHGKRTAAQGHQARKMAPKIR